MKLGKDAHQIRLDILLQNNMLELYRMSRDKINDICRTRLIILSENSLLNFFNGVRWF